MLKKRLLTALILIPLVVALILLLPSHWFAWLALVFFLVALTEWFAFAGFPQKLSFLQSLKLVFLTTVFFSLGFLFFTFFEAQSLLLGILPLGLMFCFWLWAFFAVWSYPKRVKNYAFGERSFAIGILSLSMAFCTLCILQRLDPKLALYVLVLVWIADSAAYFAGKQWGKHPLAKNISPGKTWEGVLGAFVFAVLFSLLLKSYLGIPVPIFVWLLINAVVVCFSIVGDLFESIFKRSHGLKDSGRLLPGHGGILDRIDALLPALPVFSFLLAISKLIF